MLDKVWSILNYERSPLCSSTEEDQAIHSIQLYSPPVKTYLGIQDQESSKELLLRPSLSYVLRLRHRIQLLKLRRQQRPKETLVMSVLSVEKDIDISRRNFYPFLHSRRNSISIVIHRPLNKHEPETNGNQLSYEMPIHDTMLSCLSGNPHYPKHDSPLLSPSQVFFLLSLLSLFYLDKNKRHALIHSWCVDREAQIDCGGVRWEESE